MGYLGENMEGQEQSLQTKSDTGQKNYKKNVGIFHLHYTCLGTDDGRSLYLHSNDRDKKDG